MLYHEPSEDAWQFPGACASSARPTCIILPGRKWRQAEFSDLNHALHRLCKLSEQAPSLGPVSIGFSMLQSSHLLGWGSSSLSVSSAWLDAPLGAQTCVRQEPHVGYDTTRHPRLAQDAETRGSRQIQRRHFVCSNDTEVVKLFNWEVPYVLTNSWSRMWMWKMAGKVWLWDVIGASMYARHSLWWWTLPASAPRATCLSTRKSDAVLWRVWASHGANSDGCLHFNLRLWFVGTKLYVCFPRHVWNKSHLYNSYRSDYIFFPSIWWKNHAAFCCRKIPRLRPLPLPGWHFQATLSTASARGERSSRISDDSMIRRVWHWHGKGNPHCFLKLSLGWQTAVAEHSVVERE